MSSKRPVDVTVLSARNLRKLRLVTAPPVAVVIIERNNDRFVTNPGTTNSNSGDDAVWKARHVFYIDEELISADEPSNIRVDVFDSSVLDCLLGTALISLETAMDHYNKAHTYALMAEGRSCGSVTLAVSVAPKSRAPLSFPSPSSSLPGPPPYGPPLPGDPPPLQKQTSGQMSTPIRGGSFGRDSRGPSASSSSPAFFRTQSHPGNHPGAPTSGQSPSSSSVSYMNNSSSPVPNLNQGYSNSNSNSNSNGSSQPSTSQPPSRPSYAHTHTHTQGPPPPPPGGYSPQPGPMNGPDYSRARAPPPPPPGQQMHSSQTYSQSGSYQPPGPSGSYPSSTPFPGYGPPRGYPSQAPYAPPYNQHHPPPPPPPPPGYMLPQRGHPSHPPGGGGQYPYPPQRSIDRDRDRERERDRERGEGYGGVGDMGSGVVEGLVMGAAAGFVMGEILDDDDDDIF